MQTAPTATEINATAASGPFGRPPHPVTSAPTEAPQPCEPVSFCSGQRDSPPDAVLVVRGVQQWHRQPVPSRSRGRRFWRHKKTRLAAFLPAGPCCNGSTKYAIYHPHSVILRFIDLRQWRRTHPDRRAPLASRDMRRPSEATLRVSFSCRVKILTPAATTLM